ncbi:hypothetical protein BP5796_13124 [Coleophoma crateriformis]|uniref:Uncharacterized protein n=1 Tax=Coleophoma crateriformis TaxID=565419 RepID=A0A3D8Q3P7_9HELO|nr:hypothetical protein BP5796_13124 [Coleophoma crateriformis]
MASYNQFGLCCNRRERRVIIFRFGNGDETREAFNQRRQRCDQTNKDNALLNARSRDVIEELTKRHWALMYLQHLATRVIQTNRLEIQFSDLPPIVSLSVHDPESSSISLPPPLMYEESIEQHLEVLEQRRKDAQIGKEASWDALSTLALGLTSDIQDNPEDVEIAFRVFNDGNHARFFTGRGDIRCSNYTSPRRIWNFVIRKPVKADQKIAIIDLRVLRRLGIAYGSSTDDLGFRPLNKTYGTGTMFATKYHLLVLGWLPPRSILGFLSIDQFEALLEQSHIDNSSSENISLPEYDKKIGFSSILQYLPAPAVIPLVS